MSRFLYTFKIAIPFCLVIAVAALAAGRSYDKSPAQSTDMSKLREQLIKHDVRMHDGLPRGFDEFYKSWADDYTEITEAGEVLSKEEVRSRYKASANRRPNIPPEDHSVRIYGDTIVMTHVLKKNGMKNDKDGYPVVPTVYSFRVTHLFVKRENEWRMISTQWTPVVETQAK